jgi:predicted membrane protein
MDNQERKYHDDSSFRVGGNSRNTTILLGAFVVVFGFFMLLRRMGAPLPSWLLSWEMILIGVGIFMGIKSGFRDLSWLVPIIIGVIFISDDIFPGFRFRNLIWPIGIMVVGLVILTKGSRGKSISSDWGLDDRPVKEPIVTGFKRLDEPENTTFTSNANAQSPEDEVEITAIFGGVKRNVVSKNFRGGEIVAIFGGADLDLTHADINGVVKLESTNILGGTKLIVPANWDVQSEMVAIFGGVEDKRRIQPELIDRSKRLVLVGTAFLGGLEIKSY